MELAEANKRKGVRINEDKKWIYIVIGCICFGLGTVGVVIPILPTVPFYLVTAFCFARSSEKLDTWFKGTKLYKKTP